jgi:hypothetical protein
MSDFLNSLKADLLDRRMLPILALLGVALVAAVAYAALGGGSSASAPAAIPSPASVVPTSPGIAVSPSQDGLGQPVAETTAGVKHRGAGPIHNPFTPLPEAKTASVAVTTAAGSSTNSTSGSSSGASTGTGESPSPSGGTTPAQPKKSESAKPKTVYTVAALFGAAPAGSPSPSPTLTRYEHLKRQRPLPSATQPLVVFRGVTAGGKSASFTLVGEAILRGAAACLPNASQCQAIDLQPGQVEELEYVPPEGAPVIYQLQVVSIDASKASASAARRSFREESKAGLRFLRAAGLSELPGLRYSTDNGVLVFADRPAFAARAHVAAWSAFLRG